MVEVDLVVMLCSGYHELLLYSVFFFFKQKTAYEMRISDWSSDVCSSDLMSTGRYRGARLGACTDCRRFWAQYRAGALDDNQIGEIEGNLATTAGTCAVMGTASTMAILCEALGLMLPGGAAVPAVHADRLRQAEASGLRDRKSTRLNSSH